MSPALAFNYPQLRRIERSLARIRDLPATRQGRMTYVIAALECERTQILRDTARFTQSFHMPSVLQSIPS